MAEKAKEERQSPRHDSRKERLNGKKSRYDTDRPFKPHEGLARPVDKRGPKAGDMTTKWTQSEVRYMGYKKLEDLLKRDQGDALLYLASPKNGFRELLVSEKLEGGLLSLLLSVLAYVGQADQLRSHLITVLNITNESPLLSAGGPVQSCIIEMVLARNSQAVDVNFLGNVLNLVHLLLTLLPRSSHLHASTLLPLIQKVVDDKADSGNIVCLKRQLQQATEIKDAVENDLRMGFKAQDAENAPEDLTTPPDDFRECSIFPSREDLITDEQPFLRANIVKGKYSSVDHYLDVQFRLLREDFIAPLRNGIREYLVNLDRGQEHVRLSDVRVYHHVYFQMPNCAKNQITYPVKFDVSRLSKVRWEHSKRLICGSLVCLSKDRFETVIFATVADRDPKKLREGIIELHCDAESLAVISTSMREVFVMVESSAYFEAYRHVLRGLQELNQENLPLQKYIIGCDSAPRPPKYILDSGLLLDLTCLIDRDTVGRQKFEAVDIFKEDTWPNAATLNLDESQSAALKSALTKEFSVIQGPPGTGKTYIGLKVVRALLANRRMWASGRREENGNVIQHRPLDLLDPGEEDPEKRDFNKPILLVCYTNHALDQFLEGIVKFQPSKVARIGGRSSSKDPALQMCLLHNMKKDHPTDRVRRGEIARLHGELSLLAKTISYFANIHNSLIYIGYKQIRSLLSESQQESLEYVAIDVSSPFDYWLLAEDRKIVLQQEIKQRHQFKNDSQSAGEEPADINETNPQASDRDVEDGDELLAESQEKTVYRSKGSAEETVGVGETGPQESNSDVEDGDNLLAESEGNGVNQNKEFDVCEPCNTKEELSDGESDLDDTAAGLKTPETIEEDGDMRKSDSESLLNKEDSSVAVKGEAGLLSDQREIIEGEYDYESDEMSFIEAEDFLDDVQIVDDDTDILETIAQHVVKSEEMEEDAYTTEVDKSEQPLKISKKMKREMQLEMKKFESELHKASCGDDYMTEEEAESIENLWVLSIADRWRLYRYWKRLFYEDILQRLQYQIIEYDRTRLALQEIYDDLDFQLLQNMYILGMTTTGAAKYHHILRRLRPRIVIVEEAAEVFESHIVTALTEGCEHLILIGDHQQLRPNPAVYALAKKFNLEISLFERMVRNGMHCDRLAIQHRMRPEISRLLVPEMYDHLLDHESVRHYENVRGIEENLFFIDHSFEEESDNDSKSHSNKHEASFLAALCQYLMNQGYSKSQITILTTYTGQLFEMKNNLPRDKFQGIRVTPVDNFQGEENDIILLSLVRSNKEERIGFLSISNRVCVALSRARMGFYCVGNVSLMARQSSLWKKLVNKLKERQQVGTELTLICQNHPKRKYQVSKKEDFQHVPDGGCLLPCEFRLDCGHVCARRCHPYDLDHQLYTCEKPCEKPCDVGHKTCKRECFEICSPCSFIVTVRLPKCHHEILTECHRDPDDIICPIPCERLLNCGHECKNLCSEPCTVQCERQVLKYLPCGHSCLLPCHQDETLVTCDTLVERQLPCNHVTNVACHTDISTYKCTELMQKILPCGHEIAAPCYQDVTCEKIVERQLPCYHVANVACHTDTRIYKCPVLMQKILPCGHMIAGPCYQDVTNIECQLPVTVRLPCAHHIEVKCHERYTAMSLRCTVHVERSLSCGHTGIMSCHLDVGNYICRQKMMLTFPKCNHQVEVKCATKEKVLSKGCEVQVERMLSCGHQVKAICGMAERELVEACPAVCKKTRACGHICEGTCGSCRQGTRHIPCSSPCLLVFPCGHPCKEKCSAVCKPCSVGCERSCAHLTKCTKKCSDFCKRCPLPCDWKCYHAQCKSLCSEICSDRLICDEPCPEKLSCGHPCIGMCGEPCPLLCRICSKKSRVFAGLPPWSRFIRVQPCNHVIEVTKMDAHMARQGDVVTLGPKRCPVPSCRKIIQICPRYGRELKTYIKAKDEASAILRYEYSLCQQVLKSAELITRIRALDSPICAEIFDFCSTSEIEGQKVQRDKETSLMLLTMGTILDATDAIKEVNLLKFYLDSTSQANLNSILERLRSAEDDADLFNLVNTLQHLFLRSLILSSRTGLDEMNMGLVKAQCIETLDYPWSELVLIFKKLKGVDDQRSRQMKALLHAPFTLPERRQWWYCRRGHVMRTSSKEAPACEACDLGEDTDLSLHQESWTSAGATDSSGQRRLETIAGRRGGGGGLARGGGRGRGGRGRGGQGRGGRR
ncbi:NFX1-type zinc finger-containing protein 1-like [Lingula anatina]|uniref:NFX1-type zinc finger-containing protein 1-like n=1 Tax=Lingula anatina TaxID=7574 RepID=A0A1S3JUT0_LINAN|nr:NFX1-type zinc finger-containing protein 1-like [Lingula anatina]|eukprot:XP_013414130.1 NFX1-type zinc finger-containing protein 1-like [Lingula anatina]